MLHWWEVFMSTSDLELIRHEPWLVSERRLYVLGFGLPGAGIACLCYRAGVAGILPAIMFAGPLLYGAAVCAMQTTTAYEGTCPVCSSRHRFSSEYREYLCWQTKTWIAVEANKLVVSSDQTSPAGKGRTTTTLYPPPKPYEDRQGPPWRPSRRP
jgi:hypothetical protein